MYCAPLPSRKYTNQSTTYLRVVPDSSLAPQTTYLVVHGHDVGEVGEGECDPHGEGQVDPAVAVARQGRCRLGLPQSKSPLNLAGIFLGLQQSWVALVPSSLSLANEGPYLN